MSLADAHATAPSSTRLPLSVLTLILAVAFWPGISGAATSTRWIVLSLGVPLVVMRIPISMTIGHWLGAAWLAWSALSLAWTPSRDDGLDALWHFLLLGGAFCIGAAVEDLGPAYRALVLSVSVSGFLALAQLFGFTGIQQVVAPAGLFMNKNALAEIGALALLPAIAARKWWLLPGPLLAWLLPLSRGALLGVFAAGCVWLWRRSRYAAIGVILFAGLAGALALRESQVLPGPLGRLAAQQSLDERLAIWGDAVFGLNLVGHGVGSFRAAYPAYATRLDTYQVRPAAAHNDLLNVASETGIACLLLVALVVLALRSEGDELDKLVLVAFLALGGFAFPLYAPATGFMGALVAGHLCRAGPRLRVDLRHWRISLFVGEPAGLADRTKIL